MQRPSDSHANYRKVLEFKEDPSWRHKVMRRWWGEVSSITLDQGVENGLSVPANKNTVVNRAGDSTQRPRRPAERHR